MNITVSSIPGSVTTSAAIEARDRPARRQIARHAATNYETLADIRNQALRQFAVENATWLILALSALALMILCIVG